MKANETTEKVVTTETTEVKATKATPAKATPAKAKATKVKAEKAQAPDVKEVKTTKTKAPAKSKKVVVNLSATDKIREMNTADIAKRVNDLKHELYTLRFQAAVGKLENTAQLRKVKKEIARLYTIQTEKAKATVSE